ncbi:MAG: hypothetical protein U9R66_10560, partial [Thermodesulfobacteriota bacterium]|nr:hypothetical protein [Thermodesulfobacteriota bacterium]
DFVIAVDLNHDIVGKKAPVFSPENMNPDKDRGKSLLEKNRLLNGLNKKVRTIDIPTLTQVRQWAGMEDPLPNIFEVLVTSINIMETQITATNLKTDPPDILIQPNLGHLKFLEFNRAKEAIAEGYKEGCEQIKRFCNYSGSQFRVQGSRLKNDEN